MVRRKGNAMKRPIKALAILGTLLLLAPSTPQASGGESVPYATLSGTVKSDGQPLPGATIEVTSPALANKRTTTTANDGTFTITNLPPGLYAVTANLNGFAASTLSVALVSGRVDNVNFELKLAFTMAETVVVDPLTVLPESRMYSGYTGIVSRGGSQSSSHAFTIDGVAMSESKPRPRHPFSGLSIVSGKPFADVFFQTYGVNPTIDTEEEAISTFSVSTDGASYALARAYLNRGELPEADGVRVEEFVNAFRYAYSPPSNGEAFAVHAETFPSPHREGYHVLHLGLKGRDIPKSGRKPAHLVFVIDVSGSMDIESRLVLVKKALGLLVDELDQRDTVGIVVYGTNARSILEPVSALDKQTIRAAIQRLHAEGSTNVEDGLRQGYAMAARNLVSGAVNRVVLCTDGVANNGVPDAKGLLATVKGDAEKGITLSAVGFGMGNYNDALLEQLARTGNGNYAYVDGLDEAKRIFVRELTGTLQVIAKDVKIQVEFDPRSVVRYRLLGYESRALKTEDFDNDRVDAGEIGAGHSVTAMYELKLRDSPAPLGVVRIRHKSPDGERSLRIEKHLTRGTIRGSLELASSPARLALAAGTFAEKLRASYWTRLTSYEAVLKLIDGLSEALRTREDVVELRSLVAKTQALDTRPDRFEAALPASKTDFDQVPILR